MLPIHVVGRRIARKQFFDIVSTEEIEAVHKLEVQGKPTSPFPYVPHSMMRVTRFFTLEKLRYVCYVISYHRTIYIMIYF